MLITCIILVFLSPVALVLLVSFVALYTALRFILAAIASGIGRQRIQLWETTQWQAQYQAASSSNSLNWEDIFHIVIIPNYNEPAHILRQTIENLARQTLGAHQMILVLAMEEKEPGCLEKALSLQAQYSSQFARFLITVHPQDLPDEIPSKSANQTWAARKVWDVLASEGYSLEHLVVTTMDADTLWHPKYFEALTHQFATQPDRHVRLWQAPIRYQANVWDVNPLLRLLNAVASGFELAHVVIPWWLTMPISSYSLSFRLLVDSEYWDTDVISDEYHMLIKAYFAQGGRLQVAAIPLPFLAQAVSSKSIWQTCKSRYRQTVRHAWASKETGYMIAQMLQNPHIVTVSTWRLLLRLAHDVLLAGAGWLVVTIGTQLLLFVRPEYFPPLSHLIENPSIVLRFPFALVLTATSIMIVLSTIVLWYYDLVTRPSRKNRVKLADFVGEVASFLFIPVLTLVFLALPTLHAQTGLLMGRSLTFHVTKKS